MSLVAVFDVDGVLVDTRDLVRRAYRQVGVELPEHLWGSSWRTWLPRFCGGDIARAQLLHEQKTQAHLDLLNTTAVDVLPGAQAARTLRAQGRVVWFITSSTRQVARRTLDSAAPDLGELLAATDLDSAGKRGVLHDISPAGGVYVDDNHELGSEITAGSAWKLVHFSEQTETSLIEQIGVAWTS